MNQQGSSVDPPELSQGESVGTSSDYKVVLHEHDIQYNSTTYNKMPSGPNVGLQQSMSIGPSVQGVRSAVIHQQDVQYNVNYNTNTYNSYLLPKNDSTPGYIPNNPIGAGCLLATPLGEVVQLTRPQIQTLLEAANDRDVSRRADIPHNASQDAMLNALLSPEFIRRFKTALFRQHSAESLNIKFKSSDDERKDAINLLHKPLMEMEDVLMTNDELNRPTTEECPKLILMSAKSFVGSHKVKEQYKPDPTFTTPTYEVQGDEIEFKDLFKSDKNDNVPRHVMLSASAGMGKTTLLRRYSNKSALKAEEYPKFEVVLNLEFKLFNTKRKLLLKDLLFVQATKMSHVQKEELFEWMVANEGRGCLIVIDGLDQLPADLNDEIQQTEYYTEGYSSSFTRDLFSGRLFPHSKIFTSSREHAILNLPLNSVPDRFVSIIGLSTDSVNRLVVQFGGDDGEKILQHLKNFNLLLYQLSSNPLFLKYAVAVHKHFPNEHINSVTELLLCVIVKLMYSDHSRQIHKTGIMLRLCEMAYLATKEKRVMFRSKDLQSFDLLNFDDLVIIIRDTKSTSKFIKESKEKLLRGEELLFFSHQVLQELCTALHVCTFPLQEFKETVKDMFSADEYDNVGHWKVVKRLLVGLILNPKTSELRDDAIGEANLVDLKEKKDFLQECINKKWLQERKITRTNVLSSMLEGRFTEDCLGVDIERQSFDDFNAFCLASIISSCGNVGLLHLEDCGVSRSHLAIIANIIQKRADKNSPLHIDTLDLSDNYNIECKELWEIVVVTNVTNLKLKWGFLSRDGMKQFKRVLDQSQTSLHIETLNLSDNENIECKELWEIVIATHVNNLKLEDCTLSRDGMKQFKQLLDLCQDANQIHSLNVSLNPNIECDEFWEVIFKTSVKYIEMDRCEISQHGIKTMKKLLDQSASPPERITGSVVFRDDAEYNDDIWNVIVRSNMTDIHLDARNITNENFFSFCFVLEQGDYKMEKIKLWSDNEINKHTIADGVIKLLPYVHEIKLSKSISEEDRTKIIEAAKNYPDSYRVEEGLLDDVINHIQ